MKSWSFVIWQQQNLSLSLINVCHAPLLKQQEGCRNLLWCYQKWSQRVNQSSHHWQEIIFGFSPTYFQSSLLGRKSLSVSVGSFCVSSLSFKLIILSVCETCEIRQMRAYLVTLKLAITCPGTRSPLGQLIPRAKSKTHKEHCPEQQQKINLGTEEHLVGVSQYLPLTSPSPAYKINVWILEKAES